MKIYLLSVWNGTRYELRSTNHFNSIETAQAGALSLSNDIDRTCMVTEIEDNGTARDVFETKFDPDYKAYIAVNMNDESNLEHGKNLYGA